MEAFWHTPDKLMKNGKLEREALVPILSINNRPSLRGKILPFVQTPWYVSPTINVEECKVFKRAISVIK